MITHFINRQVFEMDYSSGAIAGDVQKQLLNYTAPAFQAIIGDILDELADGDQFYRIDRLEIDLGDVTEKGFGLPDMLDRFRKACKSRLIQLLHAAEERQFLLGRQSNERDIELKGIGRRPAVGEVHESGGTDASESIHAFGPGQRRVLRGGYSVGANRAGATDAPGKAAASGETQNAGQMRSFGDMQERGAGESASAEVRTPGIHSAVDTEWEMCRIFLLTGDLPWWADKSTLPDMNALLKKMVDIRPEEVRSFLMRQDRSSVVWRRIRWQYNGGMLKLLDRLLPEAAARRDGAHSLGEWGQDHFMSLSGEQGLGKNKGKYFKKTSYGQEYRSRILRKLTGKGRGVWLPWLEQLTGIKDDAVHEEIEAGLKQLTTFQLAFLLQVAGRSPDELETEEPLPGKEASLPGEQKPASNRKNTGSDHGEELPVDGGEEREIDRRKEGGYMEEMISPAKRAAALAVAKKLGIGNTEAIGVLLGWPEKVLLSLLKKAQRIERVAEELKEIRRQLLQQPRLLAWLLLYAPLELQNPLTDRASAGGSQAKGAGGKSIPTNDKASRPEPGLPKTTGRKNKDAGGKGGQDMRLMAWKNGERIVLEDIFQKAGFGTADEERLVVRCLKKLPEPAIRILDLFAALPEEEIKELLSSGSPITTIKRKERDGEEMQRMLVENAGLCLLAPYFPHLFKNLGYMENDRFKNIRYAGRAVHLLQYIAGGQISAPGYLLSFNKLFCGLLPGDVIPGSVRLSKKELAEADGLIAFVISNWKALMDTSINGLRGSFLCRKGILRDMGSQQLLQVERREYDILLSGVTWGYSIIRLPWMKQYIQVEW